MFLHFMGINLFCVGLLQLVNVVRATKESCRVNCFVWLMWTIVNVFGVLFDEASNILESKKEAVFMWPVLGTVFVYFYYTSIDTCESADLKSYSRTPALVSAIVMVANVAMLLGKTDAAIQFYFPKFAPNSGLINEPAYIFMNWHTVMMGMFSLSNLPLFILLAAEKNNTQIAIASLFWFTWAAFTGLYIVFKLERLDNLGCNTDSFCAWGGASIGMGLWFVLDALATLPQQKDVKQE